MHNKVLLLVSLFAFFMKTAYTQNTYLLNNTPGTAANYKTLQGALDSVPAGSIILMQGSGINYGIASVSKPVVIYGPGYFLGQNNSPYTQANLSEAMLTRLVFTSGSQGSIISGLSFRPTSGEALNTNRINVNATSNITINRCRLESVPANGGESQLIAFINSTDVKINQCYIGLNASTLTYFSNASAIVFTNNIIEGQPYLYIGSNYSSGTNSYTFQNNSMYGRIDPNSRFCNGNFINNVIINNGTDNYTGGCGMTYADHNVSNLDIFPAGGTNIINADGPNTYFLYSNPSFSSNDGIYQLKPGSVAIGYGNDGTDAGAYGTTTMRYVFSGIPAIPNIYFASPQQVGTTTGGLKIQLKIKANN